MFSSLEPSHSKIVIVGAGLAGLAAAKVLVSHGVTDFKILEAQDVPGGRLLTKKLDGGLVEVGAQWAHISGSRMFDFASECGLISPQISTEGSGIFFYPGGKQISQFLVSEISNIVQDILNRCIQFHYFENSVSIPSTVAEFMNAEFEEYLNSCNDNVEIREKKKDLFDWYVRFEVIDNSCETLGDLSAKLWGQYGDANSEQEHINLNGGFSNLVNELIGHLPEGSIITSCPISTIKWKIDVNDEEQPCELVCRDGRTYTASHVIVTSSVGYLQNNLNIFHPPLPQNYQTAIKSIGFGTINKIFLFYDEIWWEEFQGGIQLVWGAKSQSDFVTDEMNWVRSLTGFDSIMTMDKVLLGWVGGQGAVDSEKLSEQEIARHCTIVLRHFTGLPTLPEPSFVLRSTWNSNQYVCGAYSHLTPSCESCKPHPQDTLLEPLMCSRNGERNIPSLLFAGEALHKKYYSTAHGAFDCGEDQARKLLKLIKIP